MFNKKSVAFFVLTALTGGALEAGAVKLPKDPYASPLGGVAVSALSGPSSAPLNQKYEDLPGWGNSYWGAGFRIYEHPRGESNWVSINASYEAKARVFGMEKKAFGFEGAAYDQNETKHAARIHVEAIGKVLCTDYKEVLGTAGTAQVLCAKDLDKDLFNHSKCYPLSPIPACANVKVTVQGHLEAGGSFYAQKAEANLLARSRAFLRGKGSVSINAGIAEVGVRGEVMFIDFEPTKNIRVARTTPMGAACTSIQYKNYLGLRLAYLKGFVEIFGHVFWQDFSKVIFEDNGFEYTKDFLNINETVAVGSCTKPALGGVATWNGTLAPANP